MVRLVMWAVVIGAVLAPFTWWIARPSPAPGTQLVPEKDFKDVARWLAGGFGILVAVLGALAVKEKVFERVLRAEPKISLLVFCLVGVAVIAGVLSPALASDAHRVRVRALILAAAGCALWVYLALRDLPGRGSDIGEVSIVIFCAGLVVAALVGGRYSLPIGFAALLLGFICFSIGMYAAVKVSIQVQTVGGRLPRVVASTVTEGRVSTVTLTVVADRVDDANLRIELVPVDSQEPLTYAILPPDAGGGIDATLSFRLIDAPEQVVVRSVEVSPAPDVDRSASTNSGPIPGAPSTNLRNSAAALTDDGSASAAVVGPQPLDLMRIAVGRPAATSLTASAGSSEPGVVALAVSGVDIPSTSRVTITAEQDGRVTSTAQVRPSSDGSLSWSANASVSAGSTVRLSAACDGLDPGCAPVEATYVAPLAMRNLSASISADETVLTLEVVGEQLSSGEVIDVLVTSSGSRRIEIRSSVVATPDGSVSWATSLPRIEGEISLVASCPQSPSGCSATASFLETGEDAG